MMDGNMIKTFRKLIDKTLYEILLGDLKDSKTVNVEIRRPKVYY